MEYFSTVRIRKNLIVICIRHFQNFSFDKYVASTISGDLEYVNQILSAKGFQMKTLNGDVQVDAKWYESPTHHLQLFADMNMKKINIRNAFSTFNNFGQTFIQEQHLKGIGTAQIQLNASWKPHFIFDEDKALTIAKLN